MGHGGGMGGPIPEKTVGWLWGFLCGSIPGLLLGLYIKWWFL